MWHPNGERVCKPALQPCFVQPTRMRRPCTTHAWRVFHCGTAPLKIVEGTLGESAAGLHAMAVLGR